MKHITGSVVENLSEQQNASELLLWAQLFQPGSPTEFDYGHLTNGNILRKIFQEIEGRAPEDGHWCDTVDNVKDRLNNWHFLVQNVRNYYLEALQEVITMRPPNIVLLSRRPKSARAHRELEQILLLLLCAAVRCERRDYFICKIMENLDPDVQAGIMNCITNFTENPTCVRNFEKLQSSASDLSHVIRDAMNQLEAVYLEEIRDLIDQLSNVQAKLTTLQARTRLTGRSRALSLGRMNLHERSVSTISLGDPTRGELTTSTPRLTCDTMERKVNLHKHATSALDDIEDQDRGVSDQLKSVSKSDQSTTVEDNPPDVPCNEEDVLDLALCADSFVFDDAEPSVDIYPDPLDNFQIHVDKHHISVELAETKAKLRRARAEIDDQADQLNELHDQLSETRRELGQVKEERARLADAAHSARHWQDEVDALREVAERVQLLESENHKLKERAHEVDYYKARCEQLAGDLDTLTNERQRRVNQQTDEDDASTRCGTLEQELAKTRARLSELELLRNADLDEFQKLREELGQLRLEQSTREHTKPPKQAHRHGLPKPKPTCNGTHSSFDVSDDASDSQLHTLDAPTVSNLSSQLEESVSTRLDRLESENQRLLEECEFANQNARNVTEKLAETEARLAESTRTNQLMTDKLQRIETLASTQSDQIRQLEVERSKAETETVRAREALLSVQQTSDQHIAELSKENSFLTEAITVLRGRANDQASTNDQLTRLQKENSILGEAAQTATSRLARAELELSQLRMRQHRLDELETLVESLRVERDQLSASLISSNLENTSLKETCQRQATLESTLINVEGECARLRSQLASERSANELRNSMETELIQLREKTIQCDQLQEALQVAADKMNKLEAERDKLTDRVSELKQQIASRKAFYFDGHNRDPSADADTEVGDDEEEEDGVDSGNKTGDSTEETSPDQFGHGRSRRKMYTLSSNSNRYRDRRRRTRAGLESEIQRLEAELEKMEEQSVASKKQADESGLQLAQKESLISELMSDLEKAATTKRLLEDRVEQLQAELTKLQSTLTTQEQELRRLKSELRDVQSDPSSTEAGKELVSRIEQLERQLSKSASMNQNLLKQKDAHIKQLEREQSETYEQLSSERKTSFTLREQLVEEKIKFQQKTALFGRIANALQQLGVPKVKLEQLFDNETTDACTEKLEELIRSHITKQVEEKNKEIESLKQQLDRIQLHTSTAQSSKAHRSADDVYSYGPVGYASSGDRNHRSVAKYPESSASDKNSATKPEPKDTLLEQPESKADVGQVVPAQAQLTELIGTNARLQVESTTLHSQLESMRAQNSKLSHRNIELEAETKRLRSMVESAHAAEANLSADYYHLQKLHDQLIQDFESLTKDMQESKEMQRRLKNDLASAHTQLGHMQSASNEVRNLREALELERGNLKGEARQIVLLREECARLRSQVDSLTESRDRERVEKMAAVDKLREYRRQLDQTEVRASQINLELATQQNMDKRLQINLAELRSRVQIVTEANYRLEGENRSLMSQLQGLVGQNQELLTSTLETCGHRVTEERSLRERLLSLQRQKQHLEDKLIDQYRSASQSKNTVPDQMDMEANRKMNLMQKARAALTKRKDPTTTPVKQGTASGTTHFYGEPHKMSDTLLSKDSVSVEEDSLNASTGKAPSVPPTKRLIPGSVSIYDRYPDELDTRDFQAFLRCLETSSRPEQSDKIDRRGYSQKQTSLPSPSCGGLLSENPGKNKTLPASLNSPTTAALRGAKYPSGYHGNNGRQPNLYRSLSSQPVDDIQKHHFPHKPISKHGSTLSTNSAHSGLSDQSAAQASDKSKPTGSARLPYGSVGHQPLPVTDRCEKQLCEIVTTKSTCEEFGSGFHSRQGSGVSRSSSMRSFTSSPRPNLQKTNGPDSSTLACSSRNTANSMDSTQVNPPVSHSRIETWTAPCSKTLMSEELKIRGKNIPENRKLNGTECANNRSSIQRSGSMASNFDCRATNGQTQPMDTLRSADKQPVTLEIVGKPRVLLEYGDL